MAGSESEKLSLDIADSKIANDLRVLAEKEFEKEFTNICAFAVGKIYVYESALKNSPFLRKLVEKNKDKVSIVANPQISENDEKNAETETERLESAVSESAKV
jgi:hypothetical protein